MGTATETDEGRASPDASVIDAALICFARWGVTKTTLDDVARQAGCSRATVYRLFPGGKDVLVDAVLSSELDQLLTELGNRLASAPTLAEKLTAGVLYASETFNGHAALRFMLDHEPDQVLPHLAFSRFDAVLAEVAAFVAPDLVPHVGEDLALRTGEWATRIICSYNLYPSESFDLADEADVRRFVATFFLPALVPAEPSPT